MYQPLPTFPPLYPPGEWWRNFIKGILENFSENESIANANKASGIAPRAWMRLYLKGGSLLSLPVSGGASTLKNRHPDSWLTAHEAVREAVKIDHTVATLYGNQPYFIPLSPELSLEDIIQTTTFAKDICIMAFERVKRILALDDRSLIEDIKCRLKNHDSLLLDAMEEFRLKIDCGLSIPDALFTLGPDAIFSIL